MWEQMVKIQSPVKASGGGFRAHFMIVELRAP